MTKWTIRGRILVSFAILLILMIGIAALAYARLAGISTEASFVRETSLPGLHASGDIAAAQNLDYALTQAYLRQGTADGRRQLDAIMANRLSMQEAIRQYEASLTSGEDRQRFDAFRQALGQYREAQDALLNANGEGASAALSRPGSELEATFQETAAAMRDVVEGRLATAGNAAARIMDAAGTAENGIIISFAAAVGLAFLCGSYLLTAITRPLSDLSGHLEQSGSQVNASITEISSTAKQQEVMAAEVASTTLEIGATSKEISATAKELVRTMHEVSTAAEQSANLAGSGQTGLQHMEDSMRQVMAAAGVVNAKLAVLNDKAGNIGQVVTTITKVADQTNLLSLNAAIEAEKAGEYGRGFAVVATEIRRLADQTAVSTQDIEQMVKEIQSAVSAGVMSMDKFAEEVRRGTQTVEAISSQLSQIIAHAQALAPRVESVNEGMQAQTTGAEQISEALTQLSSAAQHTVESLRQSNAAIEDLRRVSTGLASDVSHFRTQVG